MYSHLIIFLGKMFKAEVKQEEKDKMNIKPKLIDKKVFLQFLKIPYLNSEVVMFFKIKQCSKIL